MNKLKLFLFATVILFSSSAFALSSSLCYGTSDGVVCTPPPTLNVTNALEVKLPANFHIVVGDAISVTLSVELQNGTFTTSATANGGTILASGSSVVAATCTQADSFCVVTLGDVTGLVTGDNIVANVRLFNPNGATTLIFDGSVVLAQVVGQFTETVNVMNPASNLEQRTFLRIVAPETDANIVVFATDDAGVRVGPLKLFVPAGHAVQLNSSDLELGNVEKNFPDGTGDGTGKWRVSLNSDQRFQVFGLSTQLSSIP